MSARLHRPAYRWFHILRNPAVRTGIYTGVCLAAVLTAWLVVANRVPVLERFATERNIAAVVALALLSTIPLMRFYRLPGNLLISGLISWTILTLAYGMLTLFFRGLSEWRSPFQIFTLGTIVFLIVTTLFWIGTIIWRARASHISHSRNHVS
ncbi:MAG TPA: hypothetical protein VK525_05585 [Candidatus Saccharimonadales bacterium]|nr:hypothetical protein [Candidatus Saccharimonadales bacterium]